jgi:hypothetical protein
MESTYHGTVPDLRRESGNRNVCEVGGVETCRRTGSLVQCCISHLPLLAETAFLQQSIRVWHDSPFSLIDASGTKEGNSLYNLVVTEAMLAFKCYAHYRFNPIGLTFRSLIGFTQFAEL